LGKKTYVDVVRFLPFPIRAHPRSSAVSFSDHSISFVSSVVHGFLPFRFRRFRAMTAIPAIIHSILAHPR
jgi:hypothetical protein